MRNVLAFMAAALAILCTVPYFVDVVRKKTKPNVVTWFTWTLLTSIATAAAIAAHEPRTALLTGATALCTGTVVLLGLKYGIAKFSAFDAVCQIGAIAGLILWFIFNSPSIAIIAAVSIDFVGMLPTLRHSWFKPQEETWETYLIAFAAAALTIASLQSLNVASLLYPAYLAWADGTLALIVIYRRTQLGIDLGRKGIHETLHE
jgi:hypothetical protein